MSISLQIFKPNHDLARDNWMKSENERNRLEQAGMDGKVCFCESESDNFNTRKT